MNRTIILVADGCGIGSAPDAAAYRTSGADTLGHCAAAVGGLTLPTLQRWGAGRLTGIDGVAAVEHPDAVVARAVEASVGNDTPTGHWELFGHISDTAAPTYPDGFDTEVLALLADAWGVEAALSGEVTSGLTVLDRHGARALLDGLPIVYTSSDSVLQIAAHTGVVPVERLYEWCETARRLADDHVPVGRVIARPFTGAPGEWVRQSGLRRDYATPAPRTAIDVLAEGGVPVVAVGKIGDIFTHRGFAAETHPDGHTAILDAALGAPDALDTGGVAVVNLAEFDYRGHARDPDGFAAALVELDATLAALEERLEEGDRVVLTADHGNDPTFCVDDDGNPTVDHTRERVPLVVRTLGGGGGDAGVVPMSSLAAQMCGWYGLAWPA